MVMKTFNHWRRRLGGKFGEGERGSRQGEMGSDQISPGMDGWFGTRPHEVGRVIGQS